MSGDEVDVTLRVIIDVILLALSPIPSLVFKVAVTPFKRGFFCDDESISHPYKPDTIPLWVVIVVGMVVPILVMIPVEILRYRRHIDRNSPKTQNNSKFLLCKKAVHPYIVSIYRTVGPFLFAIAVCQVSTDIIKYAIGRLRPHYITVCQPDWSSFSCKDAQGNSIFIEGDVCTGTEHVKEARLSHPSGHSSQSMLCAVYLVLYLQMRCSWAGSRLLRHFAQALVLYAAIYVCVSRISDYKHHWSDVLGGGVLGILIAIIVAFFVSDLFPRLSVQDVKRNWADMNSLQMQNSSSPPGRTNGSGKRVEEYEVENPRGTAIWM